MSLSKKIQNEQYRNWIRAGLGLCFLQEGLQDFVGRVVKAQHEKTLRTTLGRSTAQCNSCHVKGILPAHAGTACIMKNGRLCNCRKKNNKHCSFCSSFYDDIIRLHRYNDPNWDTDASRWCTDHWQLARCFLTTTNKNGNNNASETDAAGLLKIIINATFFKNEISSVIYPPYDDFSKALSARNNLMHCSKFELNDAEVWQYLQEMVSVLEDPKTLLHDPSAKEAAKKIKQLQNDRLVITSETETRVVQMIQNVWSAELSTNLKKIELKRLESVEEIQSAQDKAVNAIAKKEVENKDKIETLFVSMQSIEMRLSATDLTVASVQSEFDGLKEEIMDIRQRVSVIEAILKQHKTRTPHSDENQVFKAPIHESVAENRMSSITISSGRDRSFEQNACASENESDIKD